MRKLVIVLFFIFSFVVAFAQKGLHSVGGDFALVWSGEDEFTKCGMNFKYQYALSNYFRIEGVYTVCGGDDNTYTKGKSYPGPIHIVCSNIQSFFIQGRFRPYLTTGLGLAISNTVYNYYGYGYNLYEEYVTTNLVYNLGLGMTVRLTRQIELQTEIKYQLMSVRMWSNGLQFSLGLSYLF